MDTMMKFHILASAAKYDAACTSSGVERKAEKGKLGAANNAGCCHSFAADGRCITLLKVLLSNACCCDCAYCVNRRSNDVPRATLTPRELAEITVGFYKRNYIEGVFISSGVIRNADYTMELLIETARILRDELGFNGYIHAKAFHGASPELIEELGLLVDRMSVNIELPTQASLSMLAPEKARTSVVAPIKHIAGCIEGGVSHATLARRNYLGKAAPVFAPAGQSTQMIIGATPETDHHILGLTSSFYKRYGLKRVFYSAYVPVNDDPRLPSPAAAVPLTREHRLYQADWLLRFYEFRVDELLSPEHPDLDLMVDPKASWALTHMENFPMEVNRASYEELLRVPGIGVVGAKRIVRARRWARLGFSELAGLGISLKRAGYFITCNGRVAPGFAIDPACARASFEESTRASGAGRASRRGITKGQISLFEESYAAGHDTYARKGHRDVLLEAARAQVLHAQAGGYHTHGSLNRADSRQLPQGENAQHAAHAAETPSGLPAFDPLLLKAA